MDAFQGCYKDGTEPGTRDCRWFASIYFVLHILAVPVGMLTLNVMFFPLFSMLLTIVAILFIAIQPYKSSLAHYSNINAMLLLLLAIWYVCLCGREMALLKLQTLGVPFLIVGMLTAVITLLYMSTIIIKWIYSQRKFGVVFIWRLLAMRRGYDILS